MHVCVFGHFIIQESSQVMYFGAFKVQQVWQSELKSHDAYGICFDPEPIAQDSKSLQLRGGYK